MSKRTGRIANILGVSVSIAIGILYSWQGLYWVRCLENFLHGLSPPEYLPLGKSVGVLPFVIPAFFGFILVLKSWNIFAGWLEASANSRNWSRSRVFFIWLGWGTISVPLLFSIIHIVFLILLDVMDGSRIRLDGIIKYSYEFTIWWTFGGLMGGLVSAIYTAIRWSDKSKDDVIQGEVEDPNDTFSEP